MNVAASEVLNVTMRHYRELPSFHSIFFYLFFLLKSHLISSSDILERCLVFTESYCICFFIKISPDILIGHCRFQTIFYLFYPEIPTNNLCQYIYISFVKGHPDERYIDVTRRFNALWLLQIPINHLAFLKIQTSEII